jgi:hypothetical protein
MSLPQTNDNPAPCPQDSPDDLRLRAHQLLDGILDSCQQGFLTASFFHFEQALLAQLRVLGLLLLRLFLLAGHRRLDLRACDPQRRYRLAQAYATRELETSCGTLRYGRAYLIPRQGHGAGWHPLDAQLGLTRDGFSPLLVGWFCRLATRLSFRLAAEMGGMFLNWSPAASTVQDWVLGLGRPAHAYLSAGPLPAGDGEVLLIECDGKAIPTATDEELARRRGPRRSKVCPCKCQRHRGRACRKSCGKKDRRKRGDKSKNGRSGVLIVLYTLKRGEDGRLHGPINKKVYATFSCRRVALSWARQQATRRGFPQGTAKTIQIILDGEPCLRQQMRELFPEAILTLDVRHAQQRLWAVGRLLHKEGSEELAAWVEPLEALLYQGQVRDLLGRLEEVSFAGAGSKAKRKTQVEAINYLRQRQALMDYGRWREQDLVLASGVVEGAARYVVGERLDNSGMRWVVERAEAVLLLRCIEVNGDWDAFFDCSEQQRRAELSRAEVVRIGSQGPTQLPQTSKEAESRRRRRKAKAAA